MSTYSAEVPDYDVVELGIEAGPPGVVLGFQINGTPVTSDGSLVRTINFTGAGVSAQIVNGVLTLVFAGGADPGLSFSVNGIPYTGLQINGVAGSGPITVNGA